MSVQDGLEFDPSRVPNRGGADTRPAPGPFTFDWDATKASAEQSFYDVPGRANQLRSGEIAAAAAELARLRGMRPDSYYVVSPGEPIGENPIVDENRFWRDLADTRRMRPDALKDLGADQADFDKRLRGRFQSGAADRAARMARGGFVGNLIGGAVGSFTDPINIATLPLGGGGKTVAAQIVRNALLNAGVEAAEQPVLAAERLQQGGELTLGEAGMNVLGAGLGGGVLTGAGHALGAAGRAALDRVPLDLRMAMALRDSVKGDWQLAPEQVAALHVLERSSEIDASSPYQSTLSGLDRHAAMVDQVMHAMAQGPEANAGAGFVPALSPGRAAPSGIAPDFGKAWNAIVGIEGGTNRDGSFRVSHAGAVGPAQVMPATGPHAAELAGLPWDERRFRTDHDYNVALGQAYYRDLLRQFDGDPVKAAAAYNAGPGSARKGTGVRGAMERARRSGVPDDWVAFLPRETQNYVVNFRRRTGMAGERSILDPGDIGGGELALRSPDLDAERPPIDFGEHADVAGDADLPQLRRDQFPDETSWRIAQAESDARELGLDRPLVTRESVWADARNRLLEDKGGEVRGALWHDAVGPIDVKWGNSKGGLGKIADKHPEVLENLPALLDSMGVKSASENRVILQSLDHRAVVRLDFDDKAQKWLLSAYQVKGKAPSPADYRGVDVGAQDRSPAPGAGVAIGQTDEIGNGAPIQARRMGDFFEVTGPDAAKVAKALDVALTARNGEPMVGIPAHSFDRWTGDLADQGIHVVDADAPAPVEAPRLTPAQQDALEAEGLAGPPLVDEAAARSFDDPAGEGAQATADSLWHDIRAGLGDQADAVKVDLDDGKGERSIAEIEQELADDAADIDTIESCMRNLPAEGGGA